MTNKNALLLIVLYSAFSILWLYVFSITGFSLSDSVNFNVMSKIVGSIRLLFLIGFLMALSLVTLSYFSDRLERKKAIIFSIAAVILTLLISSLFFQNKMQFLLMMLFYGLGSVWVSYQKSEKKGASRRMRDGWKMAKKMTLSLAFGAVIVSVIFVNMNATYYEDSFKDSLLSLVSSFDVSKMLSDPEFIEEMVKEQIPDYQTFREEALASQGIESIDDVREKIREQYENQAGWEQIPEDRQREIIENATLTSWNLLEQQINESYQNMFGSEALRSRISEMQSKISKENIGKISSQFIEKMPFMNILIKALPYVVAFISFSAITLFGTVCVAPFAAVLNLLFRR
ncbi:hypothetical protein DRN74_00240 [Candidatus Micrarchaeota archaeon]|nr:MAG: hypothetical protein DRN74_00240 [Candidatus Micrarchaeota archaeon]